MNYSRLSKIVMVLALSAFAFLVTFNNITDYGSNFQFVQHVLSMDTTFDGNAAMYRAVTSPLLWTLGYWGIIAGEAITCLLLLIGGVTGAQVGVRAAQSLSPDRLRLALALIVLAVAIRLFIGLTLTPDEPFALFEGA